MCCESAAVIVGIAVLLQKRCHEVGHRCTIHTTNTGQKPVCAQKGGQGKDFTGKVDSMRNLWFSANKSVNRKDTKFAHSKVLKSFIHFP